ncbi:hypothetical protein UFOVP218_96 [uncultured Caudovirales phage]|uniref:Uncharacterized protein n=1 Tax=uncultured Caudovirales phage TaxID=2100421 RepID=A0A6J7WKY3_9CAUD|nr:hypothetical protein UFOVP218_96 [uncultured Caudovirales phage]
MKKDRFDLEQEIMECWSITTDIENLRVALDSSMTEDEVDNYLLGLRAIYEVKFTKLFDTFGKLIQTQQIK